MPHLPLGVSSGNVTEHLLDENLGSPVRGCALWCTCTSARMPDLFTCVHVCTWGEISRTPFKKLLQSRAIKGSYKPFLDPGGSFVSVAAVTHDNSFGSNIYVNALLIINAVMPLKCITRGRGGKTQHRAQATKEIKNKGPTKLEDGARWPLASDGGRARFAQNQNREEIRAFLERCWRSRCVLATASGGENSPFRI